MVLQKLNFCPYFKEKIKLTNLLRLCFNIVLGLTQVDVLLHKTLGGFGNFIKSEFLGGDDVYEKNH